MIEHPFSELANWDGRNTITLAQPLHMPSQTPLSGSSLSLTLAHTPGAHETLVHATRKSAQVQRSSDEEEDVNKMLTYISSDDGRKKDAHYNTTKPWEAQQESVKASSPLTILSSSPQKSPRSPRILKQIQLDDARKTPSVDSMMDAEGEDDPDYDPSIHKLQHHHASFRQVSPTISKLEARSWHTSSYLERSMPPGCKTETSDTLNQRFLNLDVQTLVTVEQAISRKALSSVSGSTSSSAPIRTFPAKNASKKRPRTSGKKTYVLVPPFPNGWTRATYCSEVSTSSPKPESPRIPEDMPERLPNISPEVLQNSKITSSLSFSHSLIAPPLKNAAIEDLIPSTRIDVILRESDAEPPGLAMFSALRHMYKDRNILPQKFLSQYLVASPSRTKAHNVSLSSTDEMGTDFTLYNSASSSKRTSYTSSTASGITTDTIETVTDSHSRIWSPGPIKEAAQQSQRELYFFQPSSLDPNATADYEFGPHWPMNQSGRPPLAHSAFDKLSQNADTLPSMDKVTLNLDLSGDFSSSSFFEEHEMGMNLVLDESVLNPWLHPAPPHPPAASNVAPDADLPPSFGNGTIDPQLLNPPSPVPAPTIAPRRPLSLTPSRTLEDDRSPGSSSTEHQTPRKADRSLTQFSGGKAVRSREIASPPRSPFQSMSPSEDDMENITSHDDDSDYKLSNRSNGDSTRKSHGGSKRRRTSSKRLMLSKSQTFSEDSEDWREESVTEHRWKTKLTLKIGPPHIKRNHRFAEEPTFCHQCRRKTHHDKMRCTGRKPTGELCGMRYCILCVAKRYEDITFDPYYTTFICPRCKNICNCTACCQKRGVPYVSTRHKHVTFTDVAPRSTQRSPSTRRTSSPETTEEDYVATGKGKERAREPWTPTPPPSELPQGMYWGTVYAVHGPRVGAAFMGHEDAAVTRPATSTAKRKRRARGQFVGAPPRQPYIAVGEPDGFVAADGRAPARLIVGSKAALSGGYVSMQELDERAERMRRQKAHDMGHSDPDMLAPMDEGGVREDGEDIYEDLQFVLAKALDALQDSGL